MTIDLLLTIGATILNGLLAGACLDQSIKQLPARHRIGPTAFSTYAKAADLGNGIIFYGILGIGAALTTIMAAVFASLTNSLRINSNALVVAAILSVLHSFATSKAAPLYFRQKKTNDETALRTIFDSFERWHTIRMILVVLTFIATLVSLIG